MMSNSTKPMVSVCMPVYNGAAYIMDSIQSVLSQTFTDLRLIVVDNCSTDNTREVVERIRDPRLTYVCNETNIGLVGNFNRCLKLATEKYVCLWAHDDIMLPDNLQQKVALLEANPQVGFVHSNIYVIDGEGNTVAEHWVHDSRRDYIESGTVTFTRYIETMVNHGASVFIGAVLARRRCYDEVGPFRTDLTYTIDNEIYMRMMLNFDVACIGTPLVKYRRHADWTSARFKGTTEALRQHYQAAAIIFQTQQERIPGARALQRKVNSAFGLKAIVEAQGAALSGDASNAWEHLRLAPRLHWSAFSRFGYWRLLLFLLSGKMGLRLYQKLRT